MRPLHPSQEIRRRLAQRVLDPALAPRRKAKAPMRSLRSPRTARLLRVQEGRVREGRVREGEGAGGGGCGRGRVREGRVREGEGAGGEGSLPHRAMPPYCAAQVASPAELEHALRLGFVPERIVFDSPAKTRRDLRRALASGVRLVADPYP